MQPFKVEMIQDNYTTLQNMKQHDLCYSYHRGSQDSQDFPWGCTFSSSSIHLLTVQINHSCTPTLPLLPTKNFIFSCSAWGCTSVSGVHLQLTPINSAQKLLFSTLRVYVHPVHPLAMPMTLIVSQDENQKQMYLLEENTRCNNHLITTN